MTQDEIIEMYLQVSKELCNDTEWCWAGVGEPLQMFAKLVAAKAIAELESQEPVAWMYVNTDGECEQIEYGKPFDDPSTTPLYTTPQRTWVGLTDEEVELYWDWEDFQCGCGQSTLFAMVRDIEARLKDRNK